MNNKCGTDDGCSSVAEIVIIIALVVWCSIGGYVIGKTDGAESYNKYLLCVANGTNPQLCKDVYL